MNRSLSAFSYEKYIINYVYYIIDLIECKQFIEDVAKKKTTSAEVALTFTEVTDSSVNVFRIIKYNYSRM